MSLLVKAAVGPYRESENPRSAEDTQSQFWGFLSTAGTDQTVQKEVAVITDESLGRNPATVNKGLTCT